MCKYFREKVGVSLIFIVLSPFFQIIFGIKMPEFAEKYHFGVKFPLQNLVLSKISVNFAPANV